jgi:solute carrier family 25 carnitine/acylcarnitine transporter 20/29
MQVSSGESMLSILQRTWRLEGSRAFFRGLSSPLAANAPINAIVFGARGNAARILEEWMPRPREEVESGIPSYWRGAVAACWAGTAQLVLCVPSEVVKCKLQVQSTPIVPATAAASASAAPSVAAFAEPIYKGSWDCTKQIYHAGGIRALYSGFWVTFWRDVPAYAAWFVAYDYTRALMQTDQQRREGKPVSQWITLSAGSVAGIATWISTYPLDVLSVHNDTLTRSCFHATVCASVLWREKHAPTDRGRLCSSHRNICRSRRKSIIQTAPPSTPPAEKKMLHVARVNYARYGAGFFFKGLAPTLLRAVPVSAVTFLVYEWALEAMGK